MRLKRRKKASGWSGASRSSRKLLSKPGQDLRRKKKWLHTDPADIAPCYYHKDLFRANFPLVEIVEVPFGEPFPVQNKFEGAVMDPMEVAGVKEMWIRRLIDATDTFADAEDERQAFARHFALLEPIKKVTRPSSSDVRNLTLSSKRKIRYEDVKDIGRPKRRKVGGEDAEGMYVVVGAEPARGSFGADRSAGEYLGHEIAPEKCVQLEGDLMEDEDEDVDAATAVLHIFDREVKPNPDKVAAILQRKFLEDKHKWNALFQGAFYAGKHCMVNIERGHGSAVYVLVMTSSSWSYGILVPEGYVQVRGGAVDVNSVEQFMKHQVLTASSRPAGSDPGSLNPTAAERLEKGAALQEQLEKGTLFYRKCFKDNPSALYKNGPMLVGKLYTCPFWYKLPQLVIAGGEEQGGQIFFDGLLRLVLGDSALDMSREDFAARMNFWDDMQGDVARSWLPKEMEKEVGSRWKMLADERLKKRVEELELELVKRAAEEMTVESKMESVFKRQMEVMLLKQDELARHMLEMESRYEQMLEMARQDRQV